MIERYRKAVGAVIGLLLFAAPAVADDAADVTAVIKSLAPIAGQTVTQGYAGGTDVPVVVPRPGVPSYYYGRPLRIYIDQRPIFLDYASSVEMEVFFAYDSAFLTPYARRQLAVLGRALEAPALVPYRYLIAGHTDARGSPGYNADLSFRRAWAVKRFLVNNFAVHPARLEVVGWGERFPRDPAHPFAAVNRRVEIILIQGTVPPTSYVPQPNVPVMPAVPPVPAVPPMPGDDVTDDLAGAPPLPPCPASMVGNPNDPRFDLDDFRPEPGIDCDPSLPPVGQMMVEPDGQVLYQW